MKRIKHWLRRKIFRFLFSKEEQITITNALFRRSRDKATGFIEGDEKIRSIAHKLAMEI